MPNGKSHFENEESAPLEEFFGKIAGTLTRFAEDFNLGIERYWHQFPSWRLNFRHPRGGLASIEVMKQSESEITIYSYWWVDDLKGGTRYSRTAEIGNYPLDDAELFNVLMHTLQLVLSWPMNTWTEVTAGYEEAWACYNEEDFSRSIDAYPLPRM